MKTIKYDIVIDKQTDVHGGWDSGFYVDVSFHRVPDIEDRNGFDGEYERVYLDRSKLIKEDGTYNMDYVADAIADKIGTGGEFEIEDEAV